MKRYELKINGDGEKLCNATNLVKFINAISKLYDKTNKKELVIESISNSSLAVDFDMANANFIQSLQVERDFKDKDYRKGIEENKQSLYDLIEEFGNNDGLELYEIDNTIKKSIIKKTKQEIQKSNQIIKQNILSYNEYYQKIEFIREEAIVVKVCGVSDKLGEYTATINNKDIKSTKEANNKLYKYYEQTKFLLFRQKYKNFNPVEKKKVIDLIEFYDGGKIKGKHTVMSIDGSIPKPIQQEIEVDVQKCDLSINNKKVTFDCYKLDNSYRARYKSIKEIGKTKEEAVTNLISAIYNKYFVYKKDIDNLREYPQRELKDIIELLGNDFEEVGALDEI